MERISPLKEKALPSPGQSLHEKLQDILYEKILFYAILIFFLPALAVMEWCRYLWPSQPNPWSWTLIAVVISIFSLVRIIQAWPEFKHYKLGRDGERVVGQFLEKLRAQGYEVFHDVFADRWNIDHVIVGPQGVFSIETKTHSKAGNQKISSDGKSVREGNQWNDTRVLGQARAEAEWLQKFIKEKCGIDLGVKPIVVYPGWFVEQGANETDVIVVNHKQLPFVLNKKETILDVEKISTIAHAIEQYVRNREEL